MKVILLIVAFAHAVSCGNVRTSSLLSPAGVTYVDGSYHAGLTAGPVNAYSAPGAGSSTVAVTAAPLVQSSPSAISATPAAYASSGSNVVASPLPLYSSTLLTEYAAVPSVQHVPAVADVPVTRINNQPGVIQKTLDVASPAVKTQRFEVRRPAIQKQFYDIEERVIVRPAGSAVVELNEPLSRTQKGPSVIQPAGGAVTVSTNQPVSVVTGPEVSSGQTSVPSASYNLRGSNALPPSPPSAQSTVPLQASVYSSQTPNIISSAPVQSSVVPVPNHAAFLTAPVQSAVGVSAVSTGSSGYNSLPSRSLSAAPEILSDDSIALENPDFNNVQSGYAASTFAHGAQNDRPYQTVGVSSPGIPLENLSRSVFQAVTPQVYSVPASVAPQAFPDRRTIFKSSLPTTQFSAPVTPVSQTQFSAPVTPVSQTQFSAPVAPVSVRTDTPTYSAFNDFVSQEFRAANVNPEISVQSQINQENQQKLIQLLTAKGGVTEVSFGRTGSTPYQLEVGDVRARVVSATPAPSFADPTNERITTRRVVVSRPIQTLQEVEVAEPVTKYERVQVSQPAVIKTASQDVVSVPTSIPVYGKVLAPVAQKTFSALHSEWQ